MGSTSEAEAEGHLESQERVMEVHGCSVDVDSIMVLANLVS
jgi:hypothetical protein